MIQTLLFLLLTALAIQAYRKAQQISKAEEEANKQPASRVDLPSPSMVGYQVQVVPDDRTSFFGAKNVNTT